MTNPTLTGFTQQVYITGGSTCLGCLRLSLPIILFASLIPPTRATTHLYNGFPHILVLGIAIVRIWYRMGKGKWEIAKEEEGSN